MKALGEAPHTNTNPSCHISAGTEQRGNSEDVRIRAIPAADNLMIKFVHKGEKDKSVAPNLSIVPTAGLSITSLTLDASFSFEVIVFLIRWFRDAMVNQTDFQSGGRAVRSHEVSDTTRAHISMKHRYDDVCIVSIMSHNTTALQHRMQRHFFNYNSF